MEEKIVKAPRIRKFVAKRMAESWHVAPRVAYTRALDVTNMKKYRAELNAREEKTKVSFNVIMMKACAMALMEYPDVNAYFDGENIIYHDDCNVGMAVNTDRGLLVPNIKAANKKSLDEIAQEMDKFVEVARAGKLMLDDMEGGTFTITSLGNMGIEHATPIINQPEMAILGVYAMKDTPVVVDGEIVIRTMQNLVLVADHRLVDGVLASNFFGRVMEILQDPAQYIK